MKYQVLRYIKQKHAKHINNEFSQACLLLHMLFLCSILMLGREQFTRMRMLLWTKIKWVTETYRILITQSGNTELHLVVYFKRYLNILHLLNSNCPADHYLSLGSHMTFGIYFLTPSYRSQNLLNMLMLNISVRISVSIFPNYFQETLKYRSLL